MKKTIAILFAALLPLAALAQTTNQVYTNATGVAGTNSKWKKVR
mgnify:CR=1 FL=1